MNHKKKLLATTAAVAVAATIAAPTSADALPKPATRQARIMITGIHPYVSGPVIYARPRSVQP